MKIKKLGIGTVAVVDKRINLSFSAESKEVAEWRLLNMGYRKGASEDCWIMPGDIVLDEDPRA